MKNIIIGLCVVMLSPGLCLISDNALAQQDGFLGASDVAPPASDRMLPPEAVLEGAYVRHPIQSRQENLHLLAGFYYGNSREWQRIYDDNRAVIKNPNSLPVGETLRIHVGDNWQPMVAYDTWFALAIRNGEWRSGVPWQRAETVSVPLAPPSTPSSSAPASSAEEAPILTPTPSPTPQPPSVIPAEAPPSEHPAEEPASPPETTASEPESSPEHTDSAEPEQTPVEEDAPAEPAF